MSSESQDKPGAELTDRLGYLLKHAQQRLAELNAVALEPFGLSGRELAVLLVFDALGPTSQQDAARRLGVDRTTMVALVDALERKEIVRRAAYAQDRRRNVVTFTGSGRETFRKALAASDAAEREFLVGMDDGQAAEFRARLRALIG